VDTARERALSFLHSRLSLQRHCAGDGERPDATAAIAALRALALLDADEAEHWRALLAAGGGPAPEPDADARRHADALLAELLSRVPPGDEDMGSDRDRFEGALHALVEVGAADGPAWDARLREVTGEPSEEEELAELRELNAGGTEQELVAVLPGPEEPVDGVRVLFALRFADGISFAIHREEPVAWDAENERDPEWLRDDLGTDYSPGGGSGSEDLEQIGFRTAPPANAAWVELGGVASRPIRMPL
jgi:hypothetical protein